LIAHFPLAPAGTAGTVADTASALRAVAVEVVTIKLVG
jgi:hypothetical protein